MLERTVEFRKQYKGCCYLPLVFNMLDYFQKLISLYNHQVELVF